MAKIFRTVGSGISKRTTITYTGDDMMPAMEAMAEDWNKAHKEGGGDYGAVTLQIVRRLEKLIARSPSKPEPDSPQDFAKRLLSSHKFVLSAIKTGNADEAARFAYEVGYLHCEAFIKFTKLKQMAANNGRSKPERDRLMAEEFAERSKASRLKPTPLKAAIGKRFGLGKTSAIEAIDRGLKKIIR